MNNFIMEYWDYFLRGLTIAGGVIGFVIYLRTELTKLRSDVSYIKDNQEELMSSIKQLNTILTQIAVQEARINMLEKIIDELRHGRGFVE